MKFVRGVFLKQFNLTRDVEHYSIQIMDCVEQADQVRRLLAFLTPVMSLET